MRHSNRAPASLESKPKLAPVEPVGASGPSVMVVWGAVVSTRNVRGALVAVPAAPACSACTTYVPSTRAGLAVALQEPSLDRTLLSVSTGEPVMLLVEKTLTVTVAESPAATPAEPVKAGVLSFVALPSAGKVRATWGSARLTVQVTLAGSGSTLPAASIARTSNVWTPSARLE